MRAGPCLFRTRRGTADLPRKPAPHRLRRVELVRLRPVAHHRRRHPTSHHRLPGPVPARQALLNQSGPKGPIGQQLQGCWVGSRPFLRNERVRLVTRDAAATSSTPVRKKPFLRNCLNAACRISSRVSVDERGIRGSGLICRADPSRQPLRPGAYPPTAACSG